MRSPSVEFAVVLFDKRAEVRDEVRVAVLRERRGRRGVRGDVPRRAEGAWFAAHRSKIGATGQLQGSQSATTVRFPLGDGSPVVIDGPEGKEAIGGYAEIDVADLSPQAQVVLTLRTVCGLSTAEIAGAFLTSEQAVVARLTRARRKISLAGIPYRVPDPNELPERVTPVLATIYLMINEGYLSSSGDEPQRRDLTDDAAWLAKLMADLMPTEPPSMSSIAWPGR
jgi:hypothetical protein